MSKRSPEMIRKELEEEFDGDVKAMADNYLRTKKQMLDLLKNGGEEYRKTATPPPNGLVRASFDVGFTPMVNVTFDVADPGNLTEEEEERIIALAVEKVRQNFEEKISGENIDFIKEYKP